MAQNLDSLLGKLMPYQKALFTLAANIEYNYSDAPIPMLYDGKDCDGITSAIILKTLLQKIGSNKNKPVTVELKPEYRLHESDAFENTLSHFLVSTDLFVDGSKIMEKLLQSNKRIVVVDHHDTWETITKNLNPNQKEIIRTRMDYFSPDEIYHRDINSNFPSALLAEEMYRVLFGYHPGIELLSAIGTLGDNSLDNFPAFKTYITERYNYDTLNDIKYTIDILMQMKDDKYCKVVQEFIETLGRSSNPEEIINNSYQHWLTGIASEEDVQEIENIRTEQQAYLNSILSSKPFTVQEETYLPKGTTLYIGELPSIAPISSIGNEIQDKDYAVIIFSNKDGKVKISSRGPEGSNLKSMLKDLYLESFSSEDMNIPGGHPKAGAGTFHQAGKTYEETKEFLLDKFHQKLYLQNN